MTDHAASRQDIILALREELVGPSPQGKPIATDAGLSFADVKDAWGPWTQAPSGEEILTRVRPCKRYGIGVLYPPQVDQVAESPADSEQEDELPDGDGAAGPELLDPAGEASIAEIAKRDRRPRDIADDADDFDLSDANALKPCVMGLTFFAELPAGSRLAVTIPRVHPLLHKPVNGRYMPREVEVPGRPPAREAALAAPLAPVTVTADATAGCGGAAEASVAGVLAPAGEAERQDAERKSSRWWLRSQVSGQAEFEAAAIRGFRRRRSFACRGSVVGGSAGSGAACAASGSQGGRGSVAHHSLPAQRHPRRGQRPRRTLSLPGVF